MNLIVYLDLNSHSSVEYCCWMIFMNDDLTYKKRLAPGGSHQALQGKDERKSICGNAVHLVRVIE